LKFRPNLTFDEKILDRWCGGEPALHRQRGSAQLAKNNDKRTTAENFCRRFLLMGWKLRMMKIEFDRRSGAAARHACVHQKAK
jgi:hypothetical protein